MRRRATRPAAGLDVVERGRLLELLRRYGRNPNSFLAMYDGPWSLFESERVDGGLPYAVEHGTALAWGDPLCAPGDVRTLLEEFTGAMRARRLRVCMVPVQGDVAELAMAAGYAVLKIGEEPVFDLTTWARPRGDRGKRLRWACNHARRAGVEIEEYSTAGKDIEREISRVRSAWEASLGRRPVRSFMQAAPLELAEHKRIFLARQDGVVVAVLACTPVHGRDGWYLEDLVRIPGTVTGATELLIVEALEWLAADGARFATLGIAPLRGSDRQMDRRARWLSGALKLAFERFDARYHFASLSRFKAKFRPSGWESRYAAFLPRRPSVGLIRAVSTVLDPDPDPSEDERRTPAAAGSRVLVALQALAVGLASVAVLVSDRFGSPVGPAPLVAPVGIVGIALAAVLGAIATRLDHEPGFGVRLAVIVLEACIVAATIGRLGDHRGVLLNVVSIAVALSVVVLMVRRSPGPALHDEALPDDAGM
jgi:phosphatidylglycerol lysyltransferase